MSDDAKKSEHDAEIQVGPHCKDGLTVLDLLAEAKLCWEDFALEMYPTAEALERHFHGEADPSVEDLNLAAGAMYASAYNDRNSYGQRNYLRNLILSWAARLNEDRPTVNAWPADASYKDKAATELANALIDYLQQQQDIDAMLERAAVMAQQHTSVGFKVAWDVDAGPPRTVPVTDESGMPLFDEMGRPLEESGGSSGDVRVDLVPIFDWMTDGSEDVEDSAYCIFRRFVSEHTAAAMLAEAGIDEYPDEKAYKTVSGRQKSGVECFEIWHRKNPRIPGGLFAVVVGGHVVEARDFPYKHNELPLTVFKVGDRSDSPFGTSHLEDAVHIQRAINESLRVIHNMRKDLGEHVKLLAPSHVVEQWDAANQLIPIDNAEQMANIRWITPPFEAIKALYDDLDRDRTALQEVFGLDAETDAGRGASGKAIGFRKELEAKKLAVAARNLGKSLVRMFRQALSLYRQYMPDERLIEVAGPDGQLRVIAFKRADLVGVDVRLEPMSGAERWRAARSQRAGEMMQQKMIEPARGTELMATGLDSTMGESVQRQEIHRQIKDVLAGAPVQPDPRISPTVALDEINAARELYGPEAGQALEQLRAMYAQAAQQRQQARAQQARGGIPPVQDARRQTAGDPRMMPGGGSLQ